MKFDHFSINLNDKCNLRCKYCFITEKGNNEISYESLNNFRKFVNKYKRGRYPHVHVFGTEPLISWDKLRFLINFASIYKWEVGVTTNATLITKNKAEYLAKHKVKLLVSYDGSRKSHNKFRVFRSGHGSWSRVVRSLKYLREAGVEYGCAMTLTPENLPYLMHNVKSAASRGFKFIALNPLFVSGKEKAPEYDWELLREKYRQVASWALKHKVPLSFTWGAMESYSRPESRAPLSATCGALKGSIAVDYDEKLYICHRACGRPEFQVGDLKTGPIPEIVEAYRSRDVNECHFCPLFHQRGSCGHCYIIALDLTGDMMKLPEVVCLYQNIIHDIDLDLYNQFKETNHFLIKEMG